MEMTLYCEECKWFNANGYSGKSICLAIDVWEYPTSVPVYSPRWQRRSPYDERSVEEGTFCGPEGKLWEPKKKEEKDD